MRLRFIIPLLLLCSTAWATTRNAASCSATDVQAAINASSTGDLVTVTGPCTAAWGTQVTLSASAGITVQAITGTVTVTTDGFVLNMGTQSSRITGFTFTQNTASCSSATTPVVTSGGSLSSAPFRIDHNTFTNTNQVIDVCINGVDGLIDHNTFNIGGASEVIHLNDQGGGSGTWADDVKPGGSRQTYIETNVFNNTDNTFLCSAEESYNDAQLVFRDNTMKGCQNDIHDGSNGGRWAEVYNNTYQLGSLGSLANFVQWRGGSGVFFGNHKSTSSVTQFGPDCPSSDTCSGSWIVPRQVGAGINETTHSPAYIWGNDSGMSPTPLGAPDVPFVIGGTAAVDATNCSAHAGNVCDYVVTVSQPVTLVRCQSAADISAGCPVSYSYTPFTYPYPLTANGMPDPNGGALTPASPQNLL